MRRCDDATIRRFVGLKNWRLPIGCQQLANFEWKLVFYVVKIQPVANCQSLVANRIRLTSNGKLFSPEYKCSRKQVASCQLQVPGNQTLNLKCIMSLSCTT